MPRQTFNTTCDLFHGPGQPLAGELKDTCECRLVEQDGVHQFGPGSPNIPFYVTMEDAFPLGSWTTHAFGMKPSLGDSVAVPSGSPPQWWVVYVERIEWGLQDVYYRASLNWLPRPADCSCAIESGETCPEAIPLSLDVPQGGEIVEEPWEKWYAITLDPGEYHFEYDPSHTETNATIYFGECDDLEFVDAIVEGFADFTVPGASPLQVVFKVDTEPSNPLTFDLSVEAGFGP